MRLTQHLVTLAFVVGLTGTATAQAPPNPGSIVWYADHPQATNPAAGQVNGAIRAGGIYTENAGWKLKSVVLYINEVQAGGLLGGANAGDPIVLEGKENQPAFPVNAPLEKHWGSPTVPLSPVPSLSVR